MGLRIEATMKKLLLVLILICGGVFAKPDTVRLPIIGKSVTVGETFEPVFQSQIAFRFLSGASLPATCRVGDVFYKTAATAGQYNCTAANTWTLAAGTAGAVVANTTVGLVPYLSASNTYSDSQLVRVSS